MRGLHNRPNGRPVHPACPARRTKGYEVPCACDKQWDHWDGTQADLDRRIETALNDDMRRRTEDSDELMQHIAKDQRHNWEGFWSHAENLRCVAGKDFIKGAIDRRKHSGLTWRRAQEANK